MSIISFIFIYMAAAFFAACLFDFLHKAIGSPHQDDNGDATVYSGAIFSWYGMYVAKKYNALDAQRLRQAAQKANGYVFTRDQIEQQKKMFNIEIDNVAIMQLREKKAETIYLNDTRPNWYAPLGVCSFCTSFWVYTILFIRGACWLSNAYVLSAGGYLIAGVHFAPLAIKLHELLSNK
jgi:hypothetical protein